MTDTTTLALAAITAAATGLCYSVTPTPDTMVSELCEDSLDHLEFVMRIEDELEMAGIDLLIDADKAPGMDATIGELANYIAELLHG